MNTDAQFGKWLAAERKARGVSQRVLGSAIGAQQQTVLKIESGQRPVRLSEALALVAFLGTRLPELEVDVQAACSTCLNSPKPGFTCNTCGASGVRR